MKIKNKNKDKNNEERHRVYKSEKPGAQQTLDKLLYNKKYGPINVKENNNEEDNNVHEYANQYNPNSLE